MRVHRCLLLTTLVACGGDDGAATTVTTATTTAASADDGSTAAASDPGSTSVASDSLDPTTVTTTASDPTSTTHATHATITTDTLTTNPDTTGDPDPGTTGDPDPDTTTGTPGEACVDDHRVVAFLANWQECPSPAQMANWSHAIVSFAVSYTWTPNGNICDEACTIGEVAGCNGKSLAELAADLHAADVKVLLSFGGAGMGGLWEGTCGQMVKCWDHCVDRTDSVVASLAGIVAANDLDGVDIDYEYCLHDAAHREFVADLTTGLRTALDALPGDKLLTHAPMDHELDAGDPYFEIVDQHADAIDFLMPQYYNGGNSPFEPAGLAAIETHYRALVDGPFAGDAARVAFGYCIEPGCNPVASQPAAVDVATTVESWYPNNGGVFFWAHPNESDGWFSGPFREHYDQTACGP